jgi:hypothetical protein
MTKRVNDHRANRGYKWKEPGRMSFAEFSILVRQYVKEVLQIREQVQRAYNVFSSQGNICSDECDYLLASLRRMNAIVCTFRRLFEEPEGLPSVVTPLYYSLAAELCTVEKSVKRLIQLTVSFCSINRVVLNATVKQHYTIICSLEELLEVCENIRLCSRILLDQAHFPVSGPI